MPRLKNISSGAIVNVPEEKVERLGSEWAPAEENKPKSSAKPKTSKS
jgi:hypothetical protein